MSHYFDEKEMFLEPKVEQFGSRMVMTNVHKPLKRKFLNIDTRFSDDYNNNTTTVNGSKISYATCTITLPERISDIKNMMVCNLELPMSFYNVSENLGNNAFKISLSTTDTNAQVVKINDGQYTASGLVNEINRAISTLSYTYNRLSYSTGNGGNANGSTAGLFSTFLSGGPTYYLNFDVNSAGTFDKYNLKSKLGWMLGFRSNQYLITSTSRSEAFLDINGPRYVYLVVDEFNSSGNQNSFVAPLYTSLVNKNILARVALNGTFPYGSVLPANNFNGLLLTDKRSYTGNANLQRLRVQLIYDNGNLLSLNGLDFSFCLEIEHE